MEYLVPVTVTHPNGQSITATVTIEDADLDWSPDEEGVMRFDLDQAEDIAREVITDNLTFLFSKPVARR